MTSNAELEYKMYFLTMYNISPIQKGIQCLHAVVEYAQKYFHTPEYQRWASKDKTVILLNGGDSNIQGWNYFNGPQDEGSMEAHLHSLLFNQIPVAAFNEPSLNNSTSAIAFLADETVWNKRKYPEPEITTFNSLHHPDPFKRRAAMEALEYEALKEMYGERTAFLRMFTSNFRLA